jgi:ABC-2 type transport system permease protein
MYTLIFFFVAQVFGGDTGAAAPALEKYNGDYFSFVLIGLAFMGYINTGMRTFSNAIRTEQMLGTLEFILTTPTSLSVVLLSKMVWNFLYDSFHLTVYFLMGILFLSAKYTGESLWIVPVIMLLSLAAFSSLGMLSAGFIIIFKRGDPVNMFFSFGSILLGGVYYPIEVMPAAMQRLAEFLPITYTLRLMRDAIIRGAPLGELAPDLLKLTLLTAILLPISLWFIAFALRRAKHDGSLTHY